jgi:diguanylate cyclase (GGDEF)-like protein
MNKLKDSARIYSLQALAEAPSVAPAIICSQTHESACWIEDATRRDLLVLSEILNQLPVGVTLHAEDGTRLFANAAAIEFGEPSPAVSPALADDITSFTDEAGEHVFQATRKSVVIANERMLLSASVDITDRARAEAELARRANYDELTGLPNGYLFQDHVETLLLQPEARFAIAFVDIDNFKQINDYYSQALGDAFLVKAGVKIQRNIRQIDVLARISGDEFLVLINPVTNNDDINDIIGNIVSAMKAPFIIDGLEIFSSASIGVSVYPEHGQNYETLRRNADRAMYQVKRRGKGAAAMFHQEVLDLETSRALAEQRLRLAIQDRRFRCAFQPKVDIYTEEVMGVEALVRLLDEDGELHGPGSFIELATELNLIDDLTRLVVAQISGSIDLINEAFGPKTTISLNISAKQAVDVDFMHAIAESLDETNCASRFIVEVTEDAFVAKNKFQTQVVPMLREIGVRVSIDDFGTGYSSLSALADITADELKVDRSFITNIHQRPRSQIVLRAIESLGGALGMSVIAEGVERIEELDYLKTATAIRYVQGYYFARPMMLEDFPLPRRAAGEHRAPGGREAPGRRNANQRFR